MRGSQRCTMQLHSCLQNVPAGSSESHPCSAAAQLTGWCKRLGHSLYHILEDVFDALDGHAKLYGYSSAAGAWDCREQSTGCRYLAQLAAS